MAMTDDLSHYVDESKHYDWYPMALGGERASEKSEDSKALVTQKDVLGRHWSPVGGIGKWLGCNKCRLDFLPHLGEARNKWNAENSEQWESIHGHRAAWVNPASGDVCDHSQRRADWKDTPDTFASVGLHLAECTPDDPDITWASMPALKVGSGWQDYAHDDHHTNSAKQYAKITEWYQFCGCPCECGRGCNLSLSQRGSRITYTTEKIRRIANSIERTGDKVVEHKPCATAIRDDIMKRCRRAAKYAVAFFDQVDVEDVTNELIVHVMSDRNGELPATDKYLRDWATSEVVIRKMLYPVVEKYPGENGGYRNRLRGETRTIADIRSHVRGEVKYNDITAAIERVPEHREGVMRENDDSLRRVYEALCQDWISADPMGASTAESEWEGSSYGNSLLDSTDELVPQADIRHEYEPDDETYMQAYSRWIRERFGCSKKDARRIANWLTPARAYRPEKVIRKRSIGKPSWRT